MEKVKTWQKVTIAVLALALVSVIAAAAVHARDARMMNSYEADGAGITETTESAEYHEPVVIDETTKAPVVQQRAPSAQKVAKEMYKQFEKHYGNAYRNSSNEFYNPDFDIDGESVYIIPYHIWYQNGEMYADSYVVNATPNLASVIYVDDFSISNEDGMLADGNFGTIDLGSLEPYHYVQHRFIFDKGDFIKGDLTHHLKWNFHVQWA